MRIGKMHMTLDISSVDWLHRTEFIIRKLQKMVKNNEFNNNKRFLVIKLIAEERNDFGYVQQKEMTIKFSIKEILKINPEAKPQDINLDILANEKLATINLLAF